MYRQKHHKGKQTTIAPKHTVQDSVQVPIMNLASNNQIMQPQKMRRIIVEEQKIEISDELEEINSVPIAPRAEI